MSCNRAQGFLAAGLGVFTLGSLVACGEPDLKTALRPEGDPELLSVMILDEDFTEVATFCKSGDDKVPVIIPGGPLYSRMQDDFCEPRPTRPRN